MESTSVLEKIGHRIRDERMRLKVSSVHAAEAAGLSRVTLHRIEKGEPTVALGMYLKVMDALGLTLEAFSKDKKTHVHGRVREAKATASKRIRMVSFKDCPQLKSVAWHIHGVEKLPAKDALALYERNWRHIDQKKMTAMEKKVVDNLVKNYGNGCFLV